MTFKEAYKFAMEHSAEFAKHDAEVKSAIATGKSTGCMIFSPAPGESFYYGYDGVDLRRGKHTRKRTEVLMKRNEVLIIG